MFNFLKKEKGFSPSPELTAYAHTLKGFAEDREQVKSLISLYSSLEYSDILEKHVRALQWYTVFLYNLGKCDDNMVITRYTHNIIWGESLGMKLLYDEYMGVTEHLISKYNKHSNYVVHVYDVIRDPGFIKDISYTFRDICKRDFSADGTSLEQLGYLVYTDTYDRCEKRFKNFFL